jgi:hypothetical protein
VHRRRVAVDRRHPLLRHRPRGRPEPRHRRPRRGVVGGLWLVSAIPGTWALTNVALGGWIDRLGTVRMIELGTALFVAMTLSSWVAAGAGSFW